MTQPDIRKWRSETPGSDSVVHLNNAGAALMPSPVVEAVNGHLELESRIGGYEAADRQEEALHDSYTQVAALAGARPRNIAIVENATVGFWQALDAFDLAPGDRILATVNEYASYRLTFLALAARRGIEVITARESEAGGADLDDWKRQLADPRVRLASICWSPTNSGMLQDVPALVALAREAGIPTHVDACQAVGQVPVNTLTLGCDFLSATGRKFLRGPRGIGFLYVADPVLDAGRYPIHLDGRGATWTGEGQFALQPTARRFENWEFSYALVLGLGAAARYALDVGVENGSRRARALAAQARDRLARIPRVEVLDRGPTLGAIVSVAVPGWDAEAVVLALRARGINTSSTSRDWALLDMDRKGVTSTLRISPHYYNTEEEVEALAESLAETLAGRGT